MLTTARLGRPGRMPRSRKSQYGVMLLESLISIAIFSIGVLGLIGLQAAAIKSTGDARERAVAAFYANQLIGYMWSDARANLSSYAHNTNASDCGGFAVSGPASTNTNVKDIWIPAIEGEFSGAVQQIRVDAGNVVVVTMCWKRSPEEDDFHSFTTVAQIRG